MGEIGGGPEIEAAAPLSQGQETGVPTQGLGGVKKMATAAFREFKHQVVEGVKEEAGLDKRKQEQVIKVEPEVKLESILKATPSQGLNKTSLQPELPTTNLDIQPTHSEIPAPAVSSQIPPSSNSSK